MQLNLFDLDVDEKIHSVFIEDLKRGSGFAEGKKRIRDFYSQDLTKTEIIKLLKDEYGIGGRSTMASPNGYRQWHDSGGISIRIDTREEKQYTWSQVYDALFNLIQSNEY